jgi:hypothetical protein
MSIVEIAALSLMVTLGALVVGWVWTIANRISAVELKADAAASRADAAGISVAILSQKVEKVSDDLSRHREDVAKEYVSFNHMVALENRLVDAITGLGNRIDGLFTRVTHS